MLVYKQNLEFRYGEERNDMVTERKFNMKQLVLGMFTVAVIYAVGYVLGVETAHRVLQWIKW